MPPIDNKTLPSGHIKELDGIRGIAILMVVFFHYTVWTGSVSESPASIRALFFPVQYFWSGVDLFFTLSGFLIGGIILDNYKNSCFFKTFWIRRACRILPALALVLLTYYAMKAFLDPTRYEWIFLDEMPWWSYLTFTQNIMMAKAQCAGGALGITWSLAVEEQFYLFAPISIVVLGRKNWIRTLLFLAFFALTLRILSMKIELINMALHTSLLARMDPLVGGVLLAVLSRNNKAYQFARENRFLILMIFILMLLCTIGLMWRQGFGLFMYAWLSFLFTTFLCLTILYRSSSLTYLLRMPWLMFFGGISYGLYLYHQIINLFIQLSLREGARPSFFENAEAVTITAVAFISSVFISWISLKYIEKPILRYGHHFSYKDKTPSNNRLSS